MAGERELTISPSLFVRMAHMYPGQDEPKIAITELVYDPYSHGPYVKSCTPESEHCDFVIRILFRPSQICQLVYCFHTNTFSIMKPFLLCDPDCCHSHTSSNTHTCNADLSACSSQFVQ